MRIENKYSCSDGFCGASDCWKCGSLYDYECPRCGGNTNEDQDELLNGYCLECYVESTNDQLESLHRENFSLRRKWLDSEIEVNALKAKINEDRLGCEGLVEQLKAENADLAEQLEDAYRKKSDHELSRIIMEKYNEG